MSSPISQVESQPPQYIEPSIRFITHRVQIGQNAGAADVVVSELVKKDQVLIEFLNPEIFDDEKFARQPVEIGPNTYLSADNNKVIASVYGYPKIIFTPAAAKETQILHISVEPLFRIDSDRMKASIAIHPPLEGCHSLLDEDLDRLLSKAGIVYGVDQERLEKAKKIVRDAQPEFNVVTLAKGRKPIAGQDAYLRFEVETGPIPGRLMKDGRIDFRDRKIFVPVSEGEVIATKISPTQGKPGRTIMGELLEPEPGKDISVKTLKDAIYSSRTKKVTATRDGVLSIVGDTIIKVCSRQEIMSDIDYTTGHIESRNSVLIHGSVQPGFRVTTDGDLEIRGAVMSTCLASESNIIVKGGITGKSSSIRADGDVDLYFIEQGNIRCKGNCIIRRQSYYSTIISGGNIRCMPKSAVVGGMLIAAGSLTVGKVGSQNASPAFLAAGVDGERFLRYQTLKQSLIEQQEYLIQWIQMHRGSPRARKIKTLERKIKETRLQLSRINLIPGTDFYSRSSTDGEDSGLPSEAYSNGSEILMQDVAIEIEEIIFAGTRIQIGNSTLTVENTIANRRFKLNDTTKEIATLPLRRR